MSGGDRLTTIDRDIERLEGDKPARQARLARFNDLLAGAGLRAGQHQRPVLDGEGRRAGPP